MTESEAPNHSGTDTVSVFCKKKRSDKIHSHKRKNASESVRYHDYCQRHCQLYCIDYKTLMPYKIGTFHCCLFGSRQIPICFSCHTTDF